MSLFFFNPIVTIIVLLSAGLSVSILGTHFKLKLTRQLVLILSLLALLAGLLSCFAFDKTNLGFQFLTQFNFVSEYNLALTFGADGLSMVFLILTLIIFPVLFLASWSVTRQPKHFLNYLLAMELLLVLTFTTTDLFYFYVFFESLLIPMFILIGVWGARERKIKASYYFFLYTLFGSLFMLFGVLYLYTITGSTNYSVLFTAVLEAEQQRLIWVCFFLAFAVKMPLFPLHIWLPEAHVEAPTAGSMLLASLLLKLGGYGFLRFSLTLLSEGSTTFAPIVSSCALLGVVLGSLSTLRQIDLKRIIAYSSVAHMNLVMLGIFSSNQQGIEGAIYLMLGHGVVSTALFFVVGVLYDRHHSRLLRYYGGVATVMPLFATFFFAFTLANMSFPATSNFLGELLIFLGIFAQNSTVLLFSTAGIVLSAAYSVWLYNRVVFGTLKTQYITEFTDLNAREVLLFSTLLLPMLVLGVSGTFIIDFVCLPVHALLTLDSEFFTALLVWLPTLAVHDGESEPPDWPLWLLLGVGLASIYYAFPDPLALPALKTWKEIEAYSIECQAKVSPEVLVSLVQKVKLAVQPGETPGQVITNSFHFIYRHSNTLGEATPKNREQLVKLLLKLQCPSSRVNLTADLLIDCFSYGEILWQ